MRPASRTLRGDTLRTATLRSGASRALRAGLPVAVVGSIALTLTAAPAQADTREAAARSVDERVLRGIRAVVEQPLAARAALAAPTLTHAAPKAIRVATAAAPATYTVQRGDTISAIAARFGLRTTDVLALNGLGWKSIIYPGQVLTLSGGSPTAAAPAPAAPSAPTPSAGGYTVQGGDTISAIAKSHGVTVNAVLSANGLGWSSVIYPGQTISIPGSAALPVEAPAPAPAPVAPAPTPTTGGYTVQAGDTISAIARLHGTSTEAVLSANGLSTSSIIYPGQTIALPIAAVAASAPSVSGLTGEQAANAQLIVRIGRELGVPDRGIAIALGTAMQESWIRNLDWGDRDSLGLFQQRPSTGWGTADEVRDTVRSIKAFYGGPSDPNGSRTRGLLDVPGWESMAYADAAQAVQISAYPERYAQWESPAYAWLAALG